MSVAFCAAMPRWLSRSDGSSAIGCARIDAPRVRQIDRGDRDHLHRQPARAFRRHLDHGGDAAERRKRKALDRLLIADNLVGAGRQQAIDAPDPERMFEGDDFTSGTDGHARLPFAKAPGAGAARRAACAPSAAIAIAFLPRGEWGRLLVASCALLPRPGAKRFGARYCWNISAGSAITNFPTA